MATATKVPLLSTTLSATASSVTFSALSQSYTDLVLVCKILPTGSVVYGPYIYFNEEFNGSTNYSHSCIEGRGNSATYNRTSSQNAAYTSWNVGLSGVSTLIVNFNNYSNTSTYKTFLSRSNDTTGSYPGTSLSLGMWRSTSALTSITISWPGTFDIGSKFDLYGIL